MLKCDCCGKQLSNNYSFTRVLSGVEFNVCSDCIQYLDLLNSLDYNSSEDSKKTVEKWASKLMGRVSVNLSKITAFRNAIFQDSKIVPNVKNKEENNQGQSDNTRELNDTNNGSGSVWTTVSKVVCLFLVIGLMVAGGLIGRELDLIGDEAYNKRDYSADIVVGAVIGLVVGLVVVSGQMMLVNMVDNIADSKRYLRSIRDMLANHFAEQGRDDIFDPRKKTMQSNQSNHPV